MFINYTAHLPRGNFGIEKGSYTLRRLGISIYPARSTFEQDQAYLDLAHQYGYSRVFTSLLEINGDQTAVIKRFKQVIAYANTL